MTAPLTSEQRRAFLSGPDPQRYYPAAATEEARRRIIRSIGRSEGPALLVGAIGTGKTLLLAVLAEQFEPRMSVVTLPGAQLCTRRALLQMILGELHLPYRGMDEGELRLSILEHLRGESKPRRMLLLVDEADALPTRLLEELRVLTNVVHRGVPLVSLVLAGGPILEERFADPQLEIFSQRIGARCYLAPLTREETLQYVRSQVTAVGAKPEKWFDPAALAAIHAATGGVPRLVNQLGDQLVWLIEETGCQPLDAALVQQAWSDLQQLPAPWNTDAHSSLSPPHQSASVGPQSPAVGVIEFGDLDDDPAEARPTRRRHDGADDEAVALFEPRHAPPPLHQRDADDDRPASIPIDAARPRRPSDVSRIEATLDVTTLLVDQFDEFEELELVAEEPEPAGPPPAENPFDESFANEEILVDPYADFETQTLRGVRHVMNRVDRTFAAELARCEQRRELRKSGPVPAAATMEPVSASAPSRATAPAAPKPQRDAALVEAPPPAAAVRATPPAPVADAGPHAKAPATVVPAKQFRRLFTSLESASNRSRLG